MIAWTTKGTAMKLTDQEFQILISYHENESSMAEAQGHLEVSSAHDRRVAELEQKLKEEAEGHKGWEQENLRHDGIHRSAFRQIMGLCDPQNPIYQIAKQALHIEP